MKSDESMRGIERERDGGRRREFRVRSPDAK